MRRCSSALSLLCLLLGTALVSGGVTHAGTADAAVVHRVGFEATVAGWTSWYGSYGIGPIGDGWCIDHGLRAPDEVHGYVATTVPDASADARAAMAWALGSHGPTDRIGAAAMMLVLHDLMGATYPTGRLDVDRLTVADLAGFEGLERPVLERARAWKADALAHRHLRGPLRVDLEAPPAPVGATTVVRVTVLDARGAPVVGARVTVLSPTSSPGHPPAATTGPDGSARFPFTATAGTNRFEADVRTPATEPTAWAPTLARAQRVAQPHVLALRAAGGFEATVPTGELVVHKTGDAEPLRPVTGAAFTVTDVRGESLGRVTVGADGTTPPLRLAPGRYRVRESTPPPGYHPADDEVVQVVGGARHVVEVVDLARRGSLEIRKRSSLHDRPLAGATATVAFDADGDGTYETAVGTVTTGDDGTARLDDLLVGSYLVTELTAPAGHELLDAPVPVEVTDVGAALASVELVNRPRSTVRFTKVPAGAAPAWASLAGAVFEVVDVTAVQAVDDVPVGRCTTDRRGRCSLPPGALVGGHRHCWAEVEAPSGWGLAEPGCFVAGDAGAVVEVEVAEPSRFADVTAQKRDAVTGDPLRGATYDLYGTVAEPELRAPDGASGPEAMVWLGRAESDVRGRLRWPLVAPDQDVCVVEVAAPDGYELDPRPHCSRAPHRAEAPVHLRLVDRPAPVMGPPPTTSTTVPATSTTSTTVPPAPTTAVVTTTTAPPPATTAPAPPAPPPAPPSLPVTGSRSGPLTMTGGALILAGLVLQTGARRPRR